MRGVAAVDRLHNRHPVMDDGINPFEYRDVDCSGRSLATLMVAWVGAAMVASVLLRWKYMWIALMILTLLFLFACGYAACNARRVHERVIANEEARILGRRRRDRNIQSVSGSVENCAEVVEPPAYQTYWITDLPPPYAVVVGVESSVAPPPPPPMPRSPDSEPTIPTSRYSNPPPYCIAVQSENIVTSQTSNEPLRTIANRVETSGCDHQNTSLPEPTNLPAEQVVGPGLNAPWNDDIKIANDQTRNEGENSSNNSQTVLSTGTQYLSNIISCTFGRGPRRNNARRNSSSQTSSAPTTTNDRLEISQPNNRDNAISSGRINTSSL